MSSLYDEPTQLPSAWQRGDCEGESRALVPVAVIACHPDPERLGELSCLDELTKSGKQHIDRHWPEFRSPAGSVSRGLGVAHVSRKSLRIEKSPAGQRVQGAFSICIYRDDYSAPVMVNGLQLEDKIELGSNALEHGFELALGNHVLLFIKCMPAPGVVEHKTGLLGISAAMHRVRERISKVAAVDEPVLIRGATGTGKELVAKALFSHSGRSQKPFIPVNMAALQPSLAVAELFGSVKGAFTGASQDRKGYFQAADGGTLFLDEIGEASAEVQAMLLRALENHEVMPVGATSPVAVDVRVVAATDAELESGAGAQGFKQPLLHRLGSYQIQLPPLAERREDIPGLVRHFLTQQWQGSDGSKEVLPVTDNVPWLDVRLVSALLQAGWPGNIRQLRNVVNQLVIDGEQGGALTLPYQLAQQLNKADSAANREQDVAAASAKRRKPNQISHHELEQTLSRNYYELQATADELGISRGSVYEMIKRHPQLRNTTDFSEDELTRAYQRCDGNLEQMMHELKVSQLGLRRRLRSMGLQA